MAELIPVVKPLPDLSEAGEGVDGGMVLLGVDGGG